MSKYNSIEDYLYSTPIEELLEVAAGRLAAEAAAMEIGHMVPSREAKLLREVEKQIKDAIQRLECGL